MDNDPYATKSLWCRACQEGDCGHLKALRGYLLSIKVREAELVKREAEIKQTVDFLFAAAAHWSADP